MKPVNGKGLFGAGALFTRAAVVLVLNPPASNKIGWETGFSGVDCGVNENPLPLLFENGLALLAVVVGKSTFGGTLLGNRLPALAKAVEAACSDFEWKVSGGPKPAKGLAEVWTGCWNMPGAKATACGLKPGVAAFANGLAVASSADFGKGLALAGTVKFANGFALAGCFSGRKSDSPLSGRSSSSVVSCWLSSISTRPSLTACGTVFPLMTAVKVLRNLLASTMPRENTCLVGIDDSGNKLEHSGA